MSAAVPRPEYPRPQLRRERWHSLNGTWRFGFDDDDLGVSERWWDARADVLDEHPRLDRDIVVPFAFQAPASGIGSTDAHDIVWYARRFDDPRRDPGERLLLHFGAVDYRATVWVNGHRVAEHEGGHTPFCADIADVVTDRDNLAVVRAEDPLDDVTIPRGKQFWRSPGENIFYTPTTGIWQTVWLEPVAATRIAGLQLVPDVDAAQIEVGVQLVGTTAPCALRVRIRLEEAVLVEDTLGLVEHEVVRRFDVRPAATTSGGAIADEQGLALWSPEDPRLHDLELTLLDADGTELDTITSYFAMRKVEVRNGELRLNNRPYYPRLVLDQGYFPGGLLTAATDDDLRRDIALAKELGFNGARKHQKVEDPRWLHWADRLGFLVWDEMPSAYRYSPDMARRVVAEWQEVIARDRNHPCVIAWVPLNESWGVPQLGSDARQVAFAEALYALTRALDPTRPIIGNDGWELARTDVLAVHDYGSPEELRQRYADLGTALTSQPAGRPLFSGGHRHHGQPLIITEFGGVALVDDEGETWGYDTAVDGDTLAKRYADLIGALVASPVVAGFCYTQLTDVEQEANGLLTFDRQPKAPIEVLRRATRQEREVP